MGFGRGWGMRRRRTTAASENATRAVGRPLLQFAASGLITLVLVGVVGAFVLRQRATSTSVDDAKAFANLVATGIVERNLDDARVDRAAVDRALDGVVGDRIVRVKVWTSDGRVVYSDEPRLIGSRFPLDADEQAALRNGRALAEVSDLTKPENRFERELGDQLLEVYHPIRAGDGTPLLVETYLRLSGLAASGRAVWLPFLPVLLGALLVLWLVQAPLAWSLARRVHGAQRERERLLLRAVEASTLERRRIAADLHDGVVQDLAGVAMGISAAAGRLPREVAATEREAIRGFGASTRQAMRRLRSLLVEIYPPNLASVGLGHALTDLASTTAAAETEVEVDVPEDLELSHDVEALLFRAAQEALRNVAQHADARHAVVSVNRKNGHAVLTVADDGRGFTPDQLAARQAEGHVGLRLLTDLAETAGGAVELDSVPGRGTRLRVEVPAG
ncbi:MAG TPA: sensor histidine kinase [Gaiellaceae bacterium]|nr:sensor histidine kinase [Gaiellaceae bacterium]